jgi:hypothetical protein
MQLALLEQQSVHHFRYVPGIHVFIRSPVPNRKRYHVVREGQRGLSQNLASQDIIHCPMARS